jgi:hypothetical protein
MMMNGTRMTTAEQITFGTELVRTTLLRALADGRNLLYLSRDTEWIAEVFVAYSLANDDESRLEIDSKPGGGFQPRLVMEDADLNEDLQRHREQTGGGIDAATWGR